MNFVASAPRFASSPRTAWRVLALAAALTFSLHATHASAEEVSADSKAAARDLAIEGIQLAQSGKCEEALPPLERAEKLYHAPTILTWIGECQLQLGRLVEGTENLNRVAREQLAAGSPAAYATAQERARKLSAEATPRIAKLTIDLTPAHVEGLTITIDGAPVSTALVGAPRPTDPGEHTIVVTAPGYRRIEQAVELSEGAKESVQLTLVIDPNAPKEPTKTPPAEAAPTATSSGSTQRTWGWITVGVGGALLAGGGVTGMMAIGAKNELSCANNLCSSQDDIDKLSEANTLALTSTILFGVGGAAVATGVILLLTGSDEAPQAQVGSATVSPTLGLGSVGLNGTF